MAVLGPAVEVVVESFPCVLRVSKVVEVIGMQLFYLLEGRCKLDEVVADLTSQFSTVDQNDELRLHTRIKVHFDLRMFIAVYSHVVEIGIFRAHVLVVSLNLGTFWVPRSSKVEARVYWTSLIHMIN